MIDQSYKKNTTRYRFQIKPAHGPAFHSFRYLLAKCTGLVIYLVKQVNNFMKFNNNFRMARGKHL